MPSPAALRALAPRPLTLALALAGATIAPRHAPVADTPPRLAADSLPADTALAVGVLPNGLRYYVRSNHTPAKRAELRLVVHAGSVLEDADQRGLAHFMEHMAFNGTAHFKAHELINYLQSVGMEFGADLNAYTSYDETVYMLTVPTDSAATLAQGVQILEDWAHLVTIDSSEVVAERGVVLEEWRQRGYSNKRANELRAEQDSVYYNGAPYATRLPIGDPQRIKTALRPEIARFYHDWYRPDLMAVVAVGDFDRDQMVATIRRHFGGIANPSPERPRPTIEIPHNDSTAVKVIPLEGAGTTIRMTLKNPPHPRTGVAGYREELVERLYVNLLNHRLHELAREPKPPFLGATVGTGEMAEGRVPVQELTVYGRRAEVRAGLAALLGEVERVAQHGFTDGEIAREKTTLVRELESDSASAATIESATYARAYVGDYLIPGTDRMDATAAVGVARRLLGEITPAEIAAPSRRWRDARDRLITGEIPGLARAVDRAALLAVCDSIAATRLAPYADTEKVRSLIATAPTPGRIVSERTYPSAGVTQWTLSNGARVLLKRTPYSAGQMEIRGSAPGGLSLADDSVFVSARMAASLVRAGGMGNLSADELAEALRDKDVRRFGPSIDDDEESIVAAGAARDAATLFELLHLEVTAPRVDSATFARWKVSARGQIAAGAGGGLSAFLRRYMALQHPRTRPMTYDMVDSVDMDAALAFYRARMENAANFTFAIVGDFEPRQVRGLVERYLASLPSTGGRERARDLEIRTPRGVLEESFNVASEAKTLTYVNFSGPFSYSREGVYQLTMLASVLQQRLRERLREDLGGTYGVGVTPMAIAEPYSHYQLAIQFASAPERAKELGDALFAVFDTLKANGPTAAELQEVKEMGRRAAERERQSNEFWLAALLRYDHNGWPLDEIGSVDALNAKVTAASVQATARRVLDDHNYVRLTFRPKTDLDFDYGTDK